MKALRFLILALALWVPTPGHAQQADAPNVVVRTSVSPESGAVIGQHVTLFVDVLFPGDMPHPPRVTIPDTSGAQIFRFETQATTMRDTLAGVAYIGQRFEFAAYPRRGETLVIPAAEVTLFDRNGDATGTAVGQPMRVEVSVPPGVDPSLPVVATDTLTLDQQWSPDPASAFKAGDAIVRTITRKAADVPGLVLRDFAIAAPEGVRAYADPPRSEDRMNRGEVTGQRIDRITYVFETAGNFSLPAVSQPWWHLAEGSLETAQGAGIQVNVAALPVTTRIRHQLQDPAFWGRPGTWGLLAVILVGIAALGALSVWGVRWAYAARAARRLAWERSEAKAFRDLLAACKGTEPGSIYRAFSLWRGKLARGASEAALPLAAGLEATLYGGGQDWSAAQGEVLADKLRVQRPSLIGKGITPLKPDLPPLNPLGIA